jgi:hypothetical protein
MSEQQGNRDAYDAGHLAGRIDARLADHDRHFAAINGSVARVGDELADMRVQLQRLADSADADRRTVVTTAAALKDAEDARRAVGSDRWSPWQRIAVIVGALTAIAATVVGLVQLGN